MYAGTVEQGTAADQSYSEGGSMDQSRQEITVLNKSPALELHFNMSWHFFLSQEEKYRRQVEEASDFISRLLALLEKPGSPESKILFLRIIATIGESDRNKIEIGNVFRTLGLFVSLSFNSHSWQRNANWLT